MSESSEAVPTAQAPAIQTSQGSLFDRITNFWGTPRRLYYNWFRAEYVQRSLAMRQGDCNRCGLCCQLVVKCVFLRYENGLASCARYNTRPANCSQFPIDQSDIDEVNRIAPHAPCGYSFPDRSKRFEL